MALVEHEGKQVVPLLIDNKPIFLKDTTTLFPITSAKDNKISHYAQSADVASATDAVSSSWTAFQAWKKTSPALRREMLFRLADLFSEKADELAACQLSETSCTEQWARLTSVMTADHLKDMAMSIAPAVNGEMPVLDDNSGMCFVFKEAVGPVMIIPPWNASIPLAARAIAAALGAGCSVILKASEMCPRTHGYLAKLFYEAGLPDGVLNVIQARREDAAAVTETVIADPRLRKVEFIGSTAVGKIIGQICAKHLKPISKSVSTCKSVNH